MKSGSRSGELKVAYIGEGSMFVPSILNGIADCMKKKNLMSVYPFTIFIKNGQNGYADMLAL